MANAERERLLEYKHKKSNWKNWGPYLSERAWGTVREDYSENGNAWEYFSHDQARSRAYRWNEDGLLGFSDRNQYICFAPAFWNGQDAILKERLFGLTNTEGNHGEDVKEYYYYLDSSPTHSYVKMLYKYPQQAYPYAQLVEENRNRSIQDKEYELLDTGIFKDNRYFDIFVEYAKNFSDDILIQITANNRGPDAAPLITLAQTWFRNTWSWGYPDGPMNDVHGKPNMEFVAGKIPAIKIEHPTIGTYWLYAENADEMLFTENDTNFEKLFHVNNTTPYVKDAFHQYIIHGEKDKVNPNKQGTKSAALFKVSVSAHGSHIFRIRLCRQPMTDPFKEFESTFEIRKKECDEFYNEIQNKGLNTDQRNIQRQAFASLLCTKQLYYFDIEQWLNGDPLRRSITPFRKVNRNWDWGHLVNFDIISMPDKWEYPWYASWDLAFHCIAFVLIDEDFAKRQLTLMTREWYLHPNGQLPGYEWNFSDVNPPVHAWSAWRVYKIDGKINGKRDRAFLQGIFHKLLLNFTWWVNRKDSEGRNIFQGGFLGMDNISLFDRSNILPMGGRIDQSDGTAWMGFYSLTMMKIALELARDNPVYQDSATKFFEHFLRIAGAMKNLEGNGYALWDDDDGFFYDMLLSHDSKSFPLKVRSLVGLTPLFSVEVLDLDLIHSQEIFIRRIEWFINKKEGLRDSLSCMHQGRGKKMLSIVNKDMLVRILKYLLDEEEFLSPYGIRSVSKYHEKHPFVFNADGADYHIDYQPGESQSLLFGGNSNWRGPIWFPLNFLLIESLQKYHEFYGDELKVEFPTGSGNFINLWQVAEELSKRLTSIFTRNEKGERPFIGDCTFMQNDPQWRDYLLFHEYFHGDNGKGLGASHQTGWTALVAKLIQQSGDK